MDLEEEMILIFQQMISFLSQGGQTEKEKGSESRFTEFLVGCLVVSPKILSILSIYRNFRFTVH